MTLEQLGYQVDRYNEYNDGFLFSKQEGNATYYVDFSTEDKSFETYGFAKGHDINHPINMELYQAITLKLKELKWI
jgi:hypothetical protein